jgi:hypothetical protein
MTRRFCGTLVAVMAVGLFFANLNEADARHRRGGSDGSYGSNGGHGSWGGSAGGRGSSGGLFSRHRGRSQCDCYANHSSNGGYGSDGGYGSNGGFGSNGGYGSNGGHGSSRNAPIEYRNDNDVPDQPPPAPEPDSDNNASTDRNI